MRRISLAFALALAIASPAAQAARCDGDFERMNGAWVSTRYCRAAQIASVAREVGYRVSPQELLRNPSKVEEICRWIGSDIRVQPACEQAHGILELSF